MVQLHDPSLRRYLLGEMQDVERERVEDEYFADADVLDRLSAVEDDLIDDYLSDRLTDEDRASFERHYLAVPRHRTRVAIASALRSTPQTASQQSRAHRRGWWDNLSARLRVWPLAAQIAFAAALLLVATGGAWLIGWGSGRIVVALFAPAARPVTPTPIPNASEPAVVEPPAPRPTPPLVVAISVSPVHVRSAQEASTVVIKPGTDIVRLNLQGERGESASDNLHVVVRSVAGEEIWSGPAARAASSNPAALARVDVPAARLRPDDYIVQLLRTTASGQEVERYRYFVRVRRATAG